ncbi:hypothetical protein O181_052275 [Austropuccinia psidii MF-1]|uniref:Uncharacterized protein n=1 Tax=Austropuccinia psidii MF-1 TaxID=1389203 RepID=A0A9Q3HSI0_9BASI|nr:hypothetical protein [Austropuccinia psidii MF-1]
MLSPLPDAGISGICRRLLKRDREKGSFFSYLNPVDHNHRIGLGSLKGVPVTIDKTACIYCIIETYSRGNKQEIKTKLHQKGSQMYMPTPSHKLTAQHVQV